MRAIPRAIDGTGLPQMVSSSFTLGEVFRGLSDFRPASSTVMGWSSDISHSYASMTIRANSYFEIVSLDPMCRIPDVSAAKAESSASAKSCTLIGEK